MRSREHGREEEEKREEPSRGERSGARNDAARRQGHELLRGWLAGSSTLDLFHSACFLSLVLSSSSRSSWRDSKVRRPAMGGPSSFSYSKRRVASLVDRD